LPRTTQWAARAVCLVPDGSNRIHARDDDPVELGQPLERRRQAVAGGLDRDRRNAQRGEAAIDECQHERRGLIG